MTVISNADLQGLKADITTEDIVVESSQLTTISKLGTTIRTLAGMQVAANTAIQGLGWDNKGEFSTLPLMSDVNDVAVFEGNFWAPTSGLPYTATGSSPLTPPEQGKWVVAVTAELLGIARGLNVLNSQVIYSTDTMTLLDDVLYIYDAVEQKIWGVPTLDSTGKTIVSVVDDVLTTIGGSGDDTYQLTNLITITELQAIARSLNVLNSQVIYSTDTMTLLDDVPYIYDAVEKTTWGVPELNSIGETIVSVTTNQLQTSAALYTLTPVNTDSIPDISQAYDFNGVADLLASPITFPIGKVISTGSTRWKYNGGVTSTINDYDAIGDINIQDFIIDGIDNTSAFIEAVDYANTNNVNIVGDNSKVITLTGSSAIVVKVAFNLGSAILDVENFEGYIQFSDMEDPIVYLPGSAVVDDLLIEPTLSGNKFAGWEGLEDVSDSFVTIETTQPFYTYREVEKPRIEFNKSIAFGILESNLKYDLASNLITSVRVQKMADTIKFIGNFTLDIGDRDVGSKIAEMFNCTLTMMGLVRVKIGDQILALTNPQLIQINRCCNSEIFDLYCQRPIVTAAGTGFAYNIAMGNSYDIRLMKVKGIGDGWGATGNNSCQKVKFEDCTLSRIDFHEPFRESLDVIGCTLGSWGILVTALGDLTVDRTKFIINSDNTYQNNDGIIRTRADTGGFCDGNLIVRNSTIESDKGVAMFQHTATANNPKPVGSPIGYIAWNSIKYSNIVSKGGNILSMAPIVNSTYGMFYPYQVLIDGCSSGSFAYSADLSSQNPFDGGVTDGAVMLGDYNHRIDISNSVLVQSSDTKVVDQTVDNFRVLLNVDKCEGGVTAKELTFTFKCNADVNISNCVVSEFNLTEAGTNTKPINIAIENTRWNFLGIRHAQPMTGFTNNRSASNPARFTVNNSYLYHQTLAETREFAYAKLSNCFFWDGVNFSGYLDFGALVSDEMSFLSNQDSRNSFELLYTTGGIASVASFQCMVPGETKYLKLSETEAVTYVRTGSQILRFTIVAGTPTLNSTRLS